MDQQLRTPTSGENLAGLAIPAARPLSDFCMERVGDEVVLFDAALNRYHTLNALAYDVWRLCDGSSSIEQIAAPLDLANETVSAAVAQLGESGLLQAPEDLFESTMHRRKMMKLVAAGAIGTVGIPVVASITRLGPEASASHGCIHNQQPCGDPSLPNHGCCGTCNETQNRCVGN